jgi:molybdopterin molybdotransferase
LLKAVYADREHPPFNRVAMDGVGIAYRFAKPDNWFQLTGRLPAGVPWPEGKPSIGDAMEVMTGAALPSGWDTVIPWEYLESDGNRYRLLSGKSITRGMNVHHQGSYYHCD